MQTNNPLDVGNNISVEIVVCVYCENTLHIFIYEYINILHLEK